MRLSFCHYKIVSETTITNIILRITVNDSFVRFTDRGNKMY